MYIAQTGMIMYPVYSDSTIHALCECLWYIRKYRQAIWSNPSLYYYRHVMVPHTSALLCINLSRFLLPLPRNFSQRINGKDSFSYRVSASVTQPAKESPQRAQTWWIQIRNLVP